MSNREEIIVVGAGGHATVVIDALIACQSTPAFIVDDDSAKRDTRIGGIPVRGPLTELSDEDLKRFVFVVAIAKNELRRRLVLELGRRGARFRGVRHSGAIISSFATVDPTAQVMAGAIVNAGARIKAHAVLNSGCIVEHDANIAEFAHVGPGAILAGAVKLHEGAFAATGAKVCPFVQLGSWSTLGAGAVALQDVVAGAVAVGVPARPLGKESHL